MRVRVFEELRGPEDGAWHVVESPRGEHLAVRLEFEGMGLEFAVPVADGMSAEEFRSLVELLLDVPEELCREKAAEWLDRVAERAPVRWVVEEEAEEDGVAERWAAVDADELRALLSDDPFGHPVSIPFLTEDGYQLAEDPVSARFTRVLRRAGWCTTGPAAFVMGTGLGLRYDGRGGAVFDVGQVNDEMRLRVGLPRNKVEFRLALDDIPVTDRLLRLLLDWTDRLGTDRLLWFAAEVAAAAPGSLMGPVHAASEPLPAAPSPPQTATAPQAERAATMAERLAVAGWRPVRPRPSALFATLAAVEREIPGSGEHWYAAYVTTGYPGLPEALLVQATGPELTAPVLDGLVDVLGHDDPALFGMPTGAERLAALLERLADPGPRVRTLASLGLLGAFRAPVPGGLRTALVTGIPLRKLERHAVRPLAELEGAPGGVPWLEAAFAAIDAERWDLAARAFERAADEENDGLADLWLGALHYGADPVGAAAALDRAARAGRMPSLARTYEVWLYEQAGDAEAALTALARATEEADDEPGVWAHYGLALTKRGRADEGVAALTEALARQEDPTVLWYRGYAYLVAGDRAAALADLTRAACIDVEMAEKIHADPDLAALRGEPEFEALLNGPAAWQEHTMHGVRKLLDRSGWRENEDGHLVRLFEDEDEDGDEDDGFEVFAVRVNGDEPPGTVTLDIDDGVNGFLLFRVALGDRTEPFVDVMTRWPREFTDDGLEGCVDVGSLVHALCTAYPGGVSFLRFGDGWVTAGTGDEGD